MSEFNDRDDPSSPSSSDEENEEDSGGVGLSAATLAALKEFSLAAGVALLPDADESSALQLISQHFDVTDKEETFSFRFMLAAVNGDPLYREPIEFSVCGASRHRGQTLSSSGLTIWRAAEHLSDYLYSHSEYIVGKSICELGAGLGVVSILIDKLNQASRIVATDGDDDTLVALERNIRQADCRLIEVRKLYWGDLDEFCGSQSPFEVVVAADVIYEPEQVVPLLTTVKAIMKSDGIFILAFARRNVKMDDVFDAAHSIGFQWVTLEEGIHKMEPIYLFSLI